MGVYSLVHRWKSRCAPYFPCTVLSLLLFFTIQQGRHVRCAACVNTFCAILNRIVSNWTYCFMPGLTFSSLYLHRQHFPGVNQLSSGTILGMTETGRRDIVGID